MKEKSRSLSSDKRGVAVYFIRSIMALIVGAIIWWAGNIILLDEKTGVVPITENISDATSKFTETSGTIIWIWKIFPVVMLIAVAIYVVYSALRRDRGVRQ